LTTRGVECPAHFLQQIGQLFETADGHSREIDNFVVGLQMGFFRGAARLDVLDDERIARVQLSVLMSMSALTSGASLASAFNR
jgi:hypothetical protein